MSKFILSQDETDDVLTGDEDNVHYSCFIDFEDGMEIKATLPLTLWTQYDCPTSIIMEVIV